MGILGVVAASVAAALHVAAAPSGPQVGLDQHVIEAGIDAAFRCDLPRHVAPDSDGLPTAEDLFSGKTALGKQVERHSSIVRVPTISYDDGGDVYEDDRWLVFYELHRVLEALFPTVHQRMEIEKVNRFGLVYSIEGTDKSLRPLMLTAHQDVVPVADDSTWSHPPFSAHFDGTWLWGRGASDDKNSLTALLSAMETLLSLEHWHPKRTIVLAFGFDEESSGGKGAGSIGPHLEQKYGRKSMVMILDEGGLGLQQLNNVLYALPGVTEKGHIDVWYELHVQGGHSSVPFPHTGIGIVSEVVTTLEANPYEPKMIKGGPVHNHFVCQARYSPDADPDVTELIERGDMDALTRHLVTVDRSTHFRLQTSQSVDIIEGGVKINAMPEVVRLGVNYRVALHNSLAEIQETSIRHTRPIAEKYGLTLRAFEKEKTEQVSGSAWGDGQRPPFPQYDVDYNGTLILTSTQRTFAAPISPTDGPVWDLFSGTIQHTFTFDNGTVVPVGEIMGGNTDTRHYQGLSDHIYRFVPVREGWSRNIHTIDERLNMQAHMETLKFYYNLIRNFDASDA